MPNLSIVEYAKYNTMTVVTKHSSEIGEKPAGNPNTTFKLVKYCLGYPP
jgi:hypothetical protein